MFDRALSSLVGLTVVCAAAALAVFAAGFAIYAVALPHVGAAGAAAIVAAVAAAGVGAGGLIQMHRARAKEAEAAAAQADLAGAIPEPLRGFMQRHPIAAIAATVVGGLVAARNPRMIRELILAMRANPNR